MALFDSDTMIWRNVPKRCLQQHSSNQKTDLNDAQALAFLAREQKIWLDRQQLEFVSLTTVFEKLKNSVGTKTAVRQPYLFADFLDCAINSFGNGIPFNIFNVFFQLLKGCQPLPESFFSVCFFWIELRRLRIWNFSLRSHVKLLLSLS